jgi:hypothetical protein
MGRGEYVSFVGANGTSQKQPAPPLRPQLFDAAPSKPEPSGPSTPPPPSAPPMPRPSDPMPPRRVAPWTESQKQAFTRSIGLSAIGSVAGAVLWKEHRIWGFILGGMAGGGVGKVIFAPRDPWCDFLDSRLDSRR